VNLVTINDDDDQPDENADVPPLPPDPAGVPRTLRALVEDLPHDTDPDTGRLLLRAAPPEELKKRLLALAHGHPLSPHGGRLRTAQILQSAISWPNLFRDVVNHVDHCSACQKEKTKRPDLWSFSTAVFQPLHTLYVDHLGPLHPQWNGNNYILCLMDRGSHWLELVPVPDTTAETTANAIYHRWICEHGVPVDLVSDGGPAFDNGTLDEVCKILRIRKLVNAPRAYQAHGFIERAIQFTVHQLRMVFKEADQDWASRAPDVQFFHNTSPSSSLGISPFEALHGFAPRNHLQALLNEPGPLLTGSEPLAFARTLVMRHKQVVADFTRVEKAAYEKAQATSRHHTATPPQFDPGDYVLYLLPQPNKLQSPWTGPWLVESKTNEMEYLLTDLNDPTIHQRASARHLHHFNSDCSLEELKAEALPPGHYLVEQVLGHTTTPDGKLWVRLKYFGYHEYDAEDPRGWTLLERAAEATAVKEYCEAHALPIPGRRRRPAPARPAPIAPAADRAPVPAVAPPLPPAAPAAPAPHPTPAHEHGTRYARRATGVASH
jgi:hypothetical protein